MIRVLRLMEYTYPDAETAIADQERWQVQGVHRYAKGCCIKSTVLPMEKIEEEEWSEV